MAVYSVGRRQSSTLWAGWGGPVPWSFRGLVGGRGAEGGVLAGWLAHDTALASPGWAEIIQGWSFRGRSLTVVRWVATDILALGRVSAWVDGSPKRGRAARASSSVNSWTRRRLAPIGQVRWICHSESQFTVWALPGDRRRVILQSSPGIMRSWARIRLSIRVTCRCLRTHAIREGDPGRSTGRGPGIRMRANGAGASTKPRSSGDTTDTDLRLVA